MRKHIILGLLGACFLTLLLVGCSETSNNETKLRSDVKAALSLAAESKLFIEKAGGKAIVSAPQPESEVSIASPGSIADR